MSLFQTRIDVLNHGYVRLVSYTQPVVIDHPRGYLGSVSPEWTGDLEIVRSARVSHNADWRTGKDDGKDEKLLKYLSQNRHTSPFESMVFTFEVQAPIFVFRQWHRHRTWSYNEVSARYTEMADIFYIPETGKIGMQSSTNKQAREFESDESMVTHERDNWIQSIMDKAMKSSFDTYKYLLGRGVPREIARSVLPLATYSRMFATVDLHNLFHFVSLRASPHAQYEIRVYAEALLQLVEQVCPIAVREFRYGMEHRTRPVEILESKDLANVTPLDPRPIRPGEKE